MTELLAPAGSMEALKAAVSNGCDALYLGMQKFGARAYSCNFDEETLQEAIAYSHIRNVKVFVTMNTIVFEDELEDVKHQLKYINDAGADGVIVQDLAVFEYVVRHFPDLEAHCSTQMGIDDLEGALLLKELGAKRVVLARELSIEKVKEIRKQSELPVEVFVHGALCVSYSGNCLMSGLTGYRCGNRGRCVGSCRKLYELIDETEGTSLGKSYILSTKDLNTIDNIKELKSIDSLKIEGRMKEPVYVANVVSEYRKALDGVISEEEKENLSKTFQRTYTKGYMFHEDAKDITNIKRPNNFGYEIGKITGFYKGKYQIALSKTLNQNDMIRIDHAGEEVNLSVARLYGKDDKLINSAQKTCFIKIKEKLSPGDIVYKTKDYKYNKKLESMLEQEFRRFPLDIRVYAYPGAKLVVDAEGLGLHYLYEGEEVLEEAKNNPTSLEQIIRQFSKLNETVFSLGTVEFEESGAYVPVKMMNSARRKIVEELCSAKAESHNRIAEPAERTGISFQMKDPYLTASVSTKEQYEVCRQMGIRDIYFENIVPRNQNDYPDREGLLLVGGYGGIYRYRNSNPFVTDYSLNVVNAESCYQLFRLGAERVTISYEMNKRQIELLVENYQKENGGMPSLEMIVYGRTPMLVTKYCPMKKMNQCGKCKQHSYSIEGEQGRYPIFAHENCTTTIYNGKILNLLDEIPSLKGVQAFRLNFTTESPKTTEQVILWATGKLKGTWGADVFNQKTDTRGHFNKEIL